jgi:hypothetical protein
LLSKIGCSGHYKSANICRAIICNIKFKTTEISINKNEKVESHKNTSISIKLICLGQNYVQLFSVVIHTSTIVMDFFPLCYLYCEIVCIHCTLYLKRKYGNNNLTFSGELCFFIALLIFDSQIL